MQILIGLGVVWMAVCLLVVALCMLAARADARRAARPGDGRPARQSGERATPTACPGQEDRRARRRPPRAPIR